jgi:moderate conductance mechanosensitive channel
MGGVVVLASLWVDFRGWFDKNGIAVIAIIVIAVAVTLVTSLLAGRFRRRLEGVPSLTQEINLQRAATLTHALSTAIIVSVWTLAFLLVLGRLDLSLAPFLASAGIAGVALGFGAQSIVKDTLSGFFILLENQFGVGDVIQAQSTGGPVSGKVEYLTLRVTALRAFDGTLHIVPNGNIQVVSNKSRGWARAIVDVRVAYGEDVDRVREVLEELFQEIRQDPVLRDWIMEGPSILGVEGLADNAMVFRVVADTRPSKRWDAERRLRERITRRLTERGVRVPFPPAVSPEPGDAPAAGSRP